jgi:hypothetical protein
MSLTKGIYKAVAELVRPYLGWWQGIGKRVRKEIPYPSSPFTTSPSSRKDVGAKVDDCPEVRGDGLFCGGKSYRRNNRLVTSRLKKIKRY